MWMACASAVVAGVILFLDPPHRLHSVALFAMAAVSAFGAIKLPAEYDL